ncbi:DUF84 family protein [Patescibacteria group bacterium]|nr:DUF84 family protein [Patescibacteria group bacterium]
MHFFVGSTNPVKLEAVRTAVSEHWPEAKVFGYEVESQVSAQPLTDEETERGALNRAKAALQAGQVEHPEVVEALGVGLEGGVTPRNNELWSTVWAAVIDPSGSTFTANGARMKVPEIIARPILNGGEMGPVVSQLTGVADVRKKQGMIGIVTKEFVNRTTEYGAIAKLAIGLWFGKDWAKGVETAPHSANS